jgi:hypothetical protein
MLGRRRNKVNKLEILILVEKFLEMGRGPCPTCLSTCALRVGTDFYLRKAMWQHTTRLEALVAICEGKDCPAANYSANRRLKLGDGYGL